jgi:ketoreductase RED1
MTVPSSTVTVVAAGTIGLSWTALLAAKGLHVRVNSRNPDAGSLVASAIRLYAPAIPGAEAADMLSRVVVDTDLARSVAGAAAVLENAPENLDLKQDLFAAIEAAAPPDALLLSATSTFAPSDVGARLKDPGRLIVGHPFNPPHVIPLVEIVGSADTPPELLDRAARFYRSLGKNPVTLRKPILGFVANRLQSALLREAINVVQQGVVTVDELDAIVTSSIGLRWAVIGPFRTFHLGGGPGGLRHWLEHLGVSLDENWAQLGRPAMSPETIGLLTGQADLAFGDRTFEDLAAERDRDLSKILATLTGDDPAQAGT